MNDGGVSVIEQLKKVFIAELGIEPAEIESAAYAISPEWDSVAHIHLIESIEESFAVRFSDEEIPELTSFDLLAAALKSLDRSNHG